MLEFTLRGETTVYSLFYAWPFPKVHTQISHITYFWKVFLSPLKPGKHQNVISCQMLQVCLLSSQWPTWGIITAAMGRTRLTVNHHVDEKYGKLALDSIKKLERDRERRNYCFSISERGERSMDFKAADGWTLVALNMEQHGTGKVYRRRDIVNENWQNTEE